MQCQSIHTNVQAYIHVWATRPQERKCTFVCESAFFAPTNDTCGGEAITHAFDGLGVTEMTEHQGRAPFVLDVSYLIPMPADALDCGIVRNRNLLAQVRKHLSLLSPLKPSSTSASTHTVCSLFVDTTTRRVTHTLCSMLCGAQLHDHLLLSTRVSLSCVLWIVHPTHSIV